MVFVAPASCRLRAIEAVEKGPNAFCHSERSEESLFLFMESNRREIPRFARNDKINYFFRSLLSLWDFIGTNLLSSGRPFQPLRTSASRIAGEPWPALPSSTDGACDLRRAR